MSNRCELHEIALKIRRNSRKPVNKKRLQNLKVQKISFLNSIKFLFLTFRYNFISITGDVKVAFTVVEKPPYTSFWVCLVYKIPILWLSSSWLVLGLLEQLQSETWNSQNRKVVLTRVDVSMFDQSLVYTGEGWHNINDQFGHGSKVDMLTAISWALFEQSNNLVIVLRKTEK